ncbi:MAG: hypothetical protein M3Y58_14320 [Chloroflexota bacterium]|nr:hypothetical protein [Chloroflexota bacterium]
MPERDRRALTDDELAAERGLPLPDREEMAIINPQPMPPTSVPPGYENRPVTDYQPIPATAPSTPTT